LRKKVRLVKERRYEQTTTTARAASKDQVLTAADVARILQVSRGLVYRLIWSGELPSVSFRRILRIRARDLNEFIKESWKGGSDRHSVTQQHQDKGPEPVQGRLAKWRSERGHE
jgi:excisionase family DNA binding protein